MVCFEDIYTEKQLEKMDYYPVHKKDSLVLKLIAEYYAAERSVNRHRDGSEETRAYAMGQAFAYSCAVHIITGERVIMRVCDTLPLFYWAGRCYQFETSTDSFTIWYRVLY